MTTRQVKPWVEALICGLLWLTSCATHNIPIHRDMRDSDLQKKFEGVNSYALRLDATTSKEWINIVSERGTHIGAPGRLSLEKIGHYLLGANFVIPKTIRVTWQIGVNGYGGRGAWLGGTIVGDYTVPVAERIPESIIDYIRKNGGTLRLKIRLKDDGVLIAWDVEEWYTSPYGRRGLRHVLPGGDFKEATIFNGKVVDPGWQK